MRLNRPLSYIVEILGIIGLTYSAFLLIPTLPWWTVALTAGTVAFLFNTSAKSFLTGFVSIALLWFILTYQFNNANAGLLAKKMATLFGSTLPFELVPFHLILVTTFIGGLVGGLGAMTGNYARAFASKRNNEFRDKKTGWH